MTNDLVQIKKLHIIGEDERGITADFSLPRNQGEFIFISRKKGSASGNTYHTGKNITTNPKIFILLTGTILFYYRKIGKEDVFKEEIIAPKIIEINPFVTHKIEALSDCTLLECNSIKDIENDRIREEV